MGVVGLPNSEASRRSLYVSLCCQCQVPSARKRPARDPLFELQVIADQTLKVVDGDFERLGLAWTPDSRVKEGASET